MFNLTRKFNLCDITPRVAPSTGRLSVTVQNRLNNEPITFAEISVYYLWSLW